MPYDQLIADAGYDSEANHRFCREQLGVDSLIPAKKRRSATVVATTSYRQEMVRRLSKAGNPEDRAAYRQRWKVETVMSYQRSEEVTWLQWCRAEHGRMGQEAAHACSAYPR
jgi:hypothetical protein